MEAEDREVRLLFDEALTDWVVVFLLMFFQVAHIEILLVTSLYLTDKLLPPLLVLEVDLDVLFEVGGSREGFAAFLTDEGLILGVDAFVPVEVGFLVEPLIAVDVVAFVGFYSLVDEPVPLEGRLHLERSVAVLVLAPVALFF